MQYANSIVVYLKAGAYQNGQTNDNNPISTHIFPYGFFNSKLIHLKGFPHEELYHWNMSTL